MKNNLENFQYNVVVANIHEMYSFLFKGLDKFLSNPSFAENYRKLLITILPVIPHIINEALKTLNISEPIIFPDYDEKLLQENNANYVIQINGKKRGLINYEINCSKEKLIEIVKNDKNIKKFINDKDLTKVIYVPNKLLNIIVN